MVETKRFYPNQETGAHAVGFVENDQGLDGLEFQYNLLLRGDEISPAELEKLHLDSTGNYGLSPVHLVLNLDLLIQSKVERFLAQRVKTTGAAYGALLLMDADSGGVIAMASFPSFNPNRYWEFSSSTLDNHLVTDPVYPGELSLIFQQAAAINLDNEKKQARSDNEEAAADIPVIEPEILKRKKLSFAPRIDTVDPEYLAVFARQLGLDRRPISDIPLKDESEVSASLDLTDPDFHTSAIRLLAGFTALVNNGRLVTPHLLYQAYPAANPSPVNPIPDSTGQSSVLHPETSRDLINFLNVKWLKNPNRHRNGNKPMFFQAHRLETPAHNSIPSREAGTSVPTPRLRQSILLGAIPAENPKLTLIVLLSFPENSSDVYPEVLETYGDRLSLLAPDQDMIQKMLFVAGQAPPVPSPDFWANSANATTFFRNYDPLAQGNENYAAAASGKIMPDLAGKSLRAALQVLQHLDVDIRLVGSGRITGQTPGPGAELKGGDKCTLEMNREI